MGTRICTEIGIAFFGTICIIFGYLIKYFDYKKRTKGKENEQNKIS